MTRARPGVPRRSRAQPPASSAPRDPSPLRPLRPPATSATAGTRSRWSGRRRASRARRGAPRASGPRRASRATRGFFRNTRRRRRATRAPPARTKTPSVRRVCVLSRAVLRAVHAAPRLDFPFFPRARSVSLGPFAPRARSIPPRAPRRLCVSTPTDAPPNNSIRPDVACLARNQPLNDPHQTGVRGLPARDVRRRRRRERRGAVRAVPRGDEHARGPRADVVRVVPTGDVFAGGRRALRIRAGRRARAARRRVVADAVRGGHARADAGVDDVRDVPGRDVSERRGVERVRAVPERRVVGCVL